MVGKSAWPPLGRILTFEGMPVAATGRESLIVYGNKSSFLEYIVDFLSPVSVCAQLCNSARCRPRKKWLTVRLDLALVWTLAINQVVNMFSLS